MLHHTKIYVDVSEEEGSCMIRGRRRGLICLLIDKKVDLAPKKFYGLCQISQFYDLTFIILELQNHCFRAVPTCQYNMLQGKWPYTLLKTLTTFSF